MATNPTQNRRKAYSYIRMSTDAQLKGDSLRRQLENSQQYVAANDLELVDDLRDLGVSAFRGANVEYGALGRFIQAVRNGHIERGSYLIVEAFDRISRQPPRIALQLILELINSGITVVTLANKQAYSSENYDTQQLIISIIEMTTAAEESAKKSQRVSASWQAKRNNSNSVKLTSRGPAWLKYSVETKQFEPISERVDVIRRIFDEAIAGIGAYTIARRLNDDGLPTFGAWNEPLIRKIIENRAAVAKNKRFPSISERAGVIRRIFDEAIAGIAHSAIAKRLNDDGVPTFGTWEPSSVNKIIANPAVIGEFQLYKEEGGVRIAVGEPIKGYFPSVIARDIYHAAQAARLSRGTRSGGRKGKYFSNIFAKIVYCYYCGSRMLFEDKGDGPKGNTYFVCMSVPTGSDCVKTRWRYDDFEASFLAFVQEIDLGSIFSAEKDAAQRASIEADAASSRGQVLVLKQKRDKLVDLSLEGDMNLAYLAGKLRDLEAQIAKEEQQIASAQSELNAMSHVAARFYDSRDQIKELIDRVKVKSEDNYKIRAQIASRLRSLINRIEVASVGQSRSNQRISKLLDAIRDDAGTETALRTEADAVRALHQELIDDRENLRFFLVSFKDGTTQFVWPSAEDPLKFEQRIAPVYELGGERIQIT
jgi:DNA invertase Pin-like site-specific DNA recombinase